MKKIAVLSNINIELLKSHLQKDDFYSLYFAGFNQWQPDLLNPASKLYSFQPDFVFIYLNAEELKTDIKNLFSAIDIFAIKNQNTQFIVSNLAHPPFSISTYIKSDEQIDNELNKLLVEYSKSKENVYIFDFNRLISLYGYISLFDDKYWYLGKIKFSNLGFKALSKELINTLNCLLGKSKKVLIIDLDNTIWGGIVGEDGWQNLHISDEGIGKIYTDFQKNIKKLSQNGTILALCSKNNENDAREVFEKNTNMFLQWNDFVVHKVNWNQKTENILEIASILNIGLDSIVFIDDNPVEREMVQQNIPEITVPEFPKDVTLLNRWFINDVVYPHFSKKSITQEDLDKSNQYKRNIERDNSIKHLNYDDFIQQLNIKLTLNVADENSFKRIAQLTQKTNQFNLSTKRYTEVEIKSAAQNTDNEIYTCEYEDRFGKEGLIGCAILKIKDNTIKIDSFMLSCRVLGRRVENSFLECIIEKLEAKNIKKIEAIYIETTRNNLVKSFLYDYGFTTEDESLFVKNISN